MASKEYVVRAQRQLVIERNSKDKVVGKKRYNRGDRITLEQDVADVLLSQGGIVEVSDYNPPVLATEVEVAPAAKSGLTADAGAGLTDTVASSTTGTDELDTSSTATEVEEDFDSMSYAELQGLAKTRTGDGSGTKVELVERLNAHRSGGTAATTTDAD